MEYCYSILNGCLRCNTLNGIDYNPFCLFGCSKTGFIHHIVDIGHSLCTRLSFHTLYKLLFGLSCRHPCDALYLLDSLYTELLVLIRLFVYYIQLVLQILSDTVSLFLLLLNFRCLLVDLHLTLFEFVLKLLDLEILFVYLFLMLRFELKEFLLCLENLVFLDILPLNFSVTDDLTALLLQNNISDKGITSQSCQSRGDTCDNYNNAGIHCCIYSV